MKLNFAIVGFGRAGQRFFAHLRKNNSIKIVKIIVKTKRNLYCGNKNIGGTYADIKNLHNLDGVIIATTYKASFKYAKFFLNQKVPILIEKPFCETTSQTKKIENLFKKNKSSFLINYSDLFDPKFQQLLKYGLNKIGKIKSIIANYGNSKTLYPEKKNFYPFQNWISHPISMFLEICGNINKFKIINYTLKKKNGFLFEKLKVKLIKKNLKLLFNFSNYPKIKNRNIKIIGDKGFLKFDSYNQANNYIFYKKKKIIKTKITSFENILYYFIKNIKINKNISNLNIGIKEHLLSKNIIKKIKLKNF